jgi:D-glycero-D-manno-heptose 1,7-bisphosphate phosphatase
MAALSRYRPAVFFDRDGTLMEEVHYCNDPSKVVMIPGSDEALRTLGRLGFKRFMITNQSGIGRGIISMKQFEAVQEELLRQLGPDAIDAVYFCPVVPGQRSLRRKPMPGMAYEASWQHGVDLSHSWFVGDKKVDIECGRSAGMRTILVETGYGKMEQDAGADFIASDVPAAVALIVKKTSSKRNRNAASAFIQT